MRTRWFVPLTAIAVVAVGAVLVLRAGSDTQSTPSGSSAAAAGDEGAGSTALPTRAVTAGAVEISIEPIRIDESAAVFRIVLDTHSEALSADLAGSSVLVVDGVEWTGATWSGDPPGGHHREGELTFEATGPAAGSATLSIGGFSAPVEAIWTLGA